MTNVKVWPIAFANDGCMWASNGTFYLSNNSWWDLPSVGREDTDPDSLMADGIYRVVGITEDYCFVEKQDGTSLYLEKEHPKKWRGAQWSRADIKRRSIFTPTDDMFRGIYPSVVQAKPAAPKPVDLSWIRLANGVCYFCDTKHCHHLDRL